MPAYTQQPGLIVINPKTQQQLVARVGPSEARNKLNPRLEQIKRQTVAFNHAIEIGQDPAVKVLPTLRRISRFVDDAQQVVVPRDHLASSSPMFTSDVGHQA